MISKSFVSSCRSPVKNIMPYVLLIDRELREKRVVEKKTEMPQIEIIRPNSVRRCV